MAEQLPQEQTVSLEEAVMNNAYEIAAMFNVLERKGLISRQEVLDEVKQMKEKLNSMFEVVK